MQRRAPVSLPGESETAEAEPPPGPVRVVHVADYGGAYTGSFIPLLRSAIAATRSAGWEAEALFAEEARGRGWLDVLEADRVGVRFLPRDRMAAAMRLRDLVAGIDGTVI